MDDATVDRLQGAALAFMATSLGSMVIAMALLVLGMEYAALVLAALALGVGAPLGVLLALVAAGAAWWDRACERNGVLS